MSVMKSPFPGMDPYLEESWRDVHHRLCTYACDALQGQLGSDLRARIEERLVVESDDPDRSIFPDVRVVERGRRGRPVQPTAGVAVVEPVLVRLGSEPAPQGFIHIIDIRRGHRVVTAIEIVSPSNRLPGSGRRLYLQKQQECRDAGVSLVEIDLVRGGEPVAIARDHLPPQPSTPYQVSVLRGWDQNVVEVYPISLRQRLPAIRVPLRETDPDAALDLQAVLDQAYRNGGYSDDIDYRHPCRPPLDPDDAAWADQLLKAAGRR